MRDNMEVNDNGCKQGLEGNKRLSRFDIFC